MFFKVSSELMKNQKHSDILAPDQNFQVLQTSTGDALFFSIATDDVLYVTREISDTNTGWTSKVDLSSQLAKKLGVQSVVAKSFALSQNYETMAFDIVLVVSAKGSDYLFASFNHQNTKAAWDTDFVWNLIPFDAKGKPPPTPFLIADVYLMNIPTGDRKYVENCFVDVVENPGTSLSLLERYYITPGPSPQWRLQRLNVSLEAGSIQSCLGLSQIKSGHGSRAIRVPGIYTFGTIGGTAEVGFFPQFDPFDPTNMPPVTLFDLPVGVSAIASSVGTQEGLTTLFAASPSGLSVWTPGNQKQGANPVDVVPADTDVVKNLFAGVTHMRALTMFTKTMVWCLNTNKTLFYVTCPTGSEGDSAAWSTPVPLEKNVDAFAFFINDTSLNNVVFVHVSGVGLVRYSQYSSVGMWERHRILLPTPNVNILHELNSFTSHLQILNNDGGPAINQTVELQAVGKTSAYINNSYYSLDPRSPVTISTGFDGNITVVQETATLTAVCFEVTAMDGSMVLVDPLSKARQVLSTIGSGADLRKEQITTADGSSKPLVPSSVPRENTNAVASALRNLLIVSSKLPADGSIQTAPVQDPGTPQQFKIDYNSPLHEYTEVPRGAPLPPSGIQHPKNPARFQEGGMDYLKVKLGDLVKWMKDAFDTIEEIVVQEATGFWHLVVKVGGDIWGAVLDCVSAVANAVEFVFKKIEVFFEDLISWLGFLFAWKDIVRTHKVLKNIIKQHANELVKSLVSIEESVKDTFAGLETQITAWDELTGPETTVGQSNQASNSVEGASSPQSHWAVYHTKNGANSATSSVKIPVDIPSDVQAIIDSLKSLMQKEKENVKETLLKVKTEIMDNLDGLSAIQIVKRLVKAVGLLLAESAETIVVELLEIVKSLVNAAVGLLDAPIDIPVISPLYSKVSGGESLSILDLMCLVGAVPVTVIYKVATGSTPFPDNDPVTNSLIDATSLPEIIELLAGPSTMKQSAKAAQANGTRVNGIKVNGTHANGSLARDTSFANKVIGSLNIASFYGALVNGFATATKFSEQDENKNLNYLVATSRYMVLLPNISSYLDPKPNHIWTKANIAFMSFGAGKACVDNLSSLSKDTKVWTPEVSPFIETFIDLFGVITTVGTFMELRANGGLKTSDISSFVGDVVSNVGGTCTALTIKTLDPEFAPIIVPAISAATILGGAANLLAGISLIEGD